MLNIVRMMAWNLNIFVRVACSCVLSLVLSGCLYNTYLPTSGSSRTYSAPQKTSTAVVAAGYTVPSDFEPNYQNLSYHFVTVNRGDTLSKVAARQNVPIKSVVTLNNLRSPYTIFPGQQLKVPAFRTHSVRPGETLYAISRVYEVEMPDVAHYNFLASPYTLMPGTNLQIPMKNNGQVQVASVSSTRWPDPKKSLSVQPLKTVVINSSATVVPVPKTEVVAVAPQAPTKTFTPAPKPVKKKTALASQEPAFQVAKLDIPPVPRRRYSVKDLPQRSGKSFAWPVKGKVISWYGKKDSGYHNDGVNIRVKAGTPIRASENGVVSYVGNEMRSFGNLLLVSHADGYVTAYGHTKKSAVSKGEAVKKGDIIAYVGSSGNVTESQLHFEIRKKGRAVNPTKYLK
ncbi:MAG: peptidoglycan DD-metalloendopeptidase family protein [Sneathiella sp.]|uniref:peptidoglycan DD-metalloendopeptidase family protein n=1 Tax=Sneathiella sp. TaxID=1964365 RepID=UPI0030039816